MSAFWCFVERNLAQQDSFNIFAQPLLTMMAGIRTVTDDDVAVLNIVIHRAQPSHPVTPIDQIPVFSATPIGGAEVKFSVRPTYDTKRASRLIDATGIELRHDFGEASAPALAVMSNYFSSTKSIFILSLPESSAGKTLHVSARWIVANDQARNDQWSGLFSVIVA